LVEIPGVLQVKWNRVIVFVVDNIHLLFIFTETATTTKNSSKLWKHWSFQRQRD
jgi:hypothetical protein